MRHIVTLCLLGWQAVAGQPLRWPQDLNASHAANATDKQTIQELVINALGPDAALLVRVGEFRFVPLETPRRIDLVVSAALSGRGQLNNFVAIWQTPGGEYQHAFLRSELQDVLARDVVDLDGDGVHEIIVGRVPGLDLGVDNIGIASHQIYKLRQGAWVDVSDKYPEARSEATQTLVLAVATACSSGNKALVERYRDYALFVQSKQDRSVLHDSRAGLSYALEWADSSDPAVQWLAVETLAEIHSPTAISTLRKLALSEDRGVAAFAKSMLAQGSGGKQ